MNLEDEIRKAVEEEREACALLHDSINPGCDCQPEGCGAMGAIIAYRDAIRARGKPKEKVAGKSVSGKW